MTLVFANLSCKVCFLEKNKTISAIKTMKKQKAIIEMIINRNERTKKPRID
jgi:hypothetical protein